MNSLLLLIITIPLLHVLALQNKAASKLTKIFPVAFLALLCGVYSHLDHEVYLELINFSEDINFGFAINKTNIKQLFLLNFIWLIFGFYINRFVEIYKNKNDVQIRVFFGLGVAFINLVIMAENMITLLFCYNLLALAYYFFISRIFIKSETVQTKIFTILILIEPILLFLAIIFTIFFGGHIIFSKGGVLDNLSSAQSIFIFILYLGAILSTVLIPTFLFYHKNYIFDPLTNYLALPLFYALPKLYIFTKIIAEIFGVGAFSVIISKIGFHWFLAIFFINLLILAYFLLFSRDFKAIFFYLFFGQLIFAFYVIYLFALYDEERIYAVATNFILALTLIFLAFSNLILFLRKAESKDTTGLFYEMKTTIALLLFGFSNLIGLAPTAMMAQNFALAKIIFHSDFSFVSWIFIFNIFYLTLFSCKLFFPIFSKLDPATPRSQNDKDLAAKIDSSASLMLTSLVVAVTMLLLPAIQFFI